MVRWQTIIRLAAAVGVAACVLWSAPAGDAPKDPQERIAKGKDLVDSVCFWCHEPELMLTKHLTKDEWAYLIRPMIYEGAPVTDDEFEMITEYLTKYFGPEEIPARPAEEKQP